MWSRLRTYLIAERPYAVKILMAFSAIAIVIMLNTPGGYSSPVAKDMEMVANLNVWFGLFIAYAGLLLYGVFGENATSRMIGSIWGTFMWNGLFIFHTVVSGVGPLRGVYLVFGLFSVWNILTVYEYIRIKREYGIDLTKMANDMMQNFMKQYRR
jgi:hypothetical protein